MDIKATQEKMQESLRQLGLGQHTPEPGSDLEQSLKAQTQRGFERAAQQQPTTFKPSTRLKSPADYESPSDYGMEF